MRISKFFKRSFFMKKKQIKQRNFVQQHVMEFNKAQVFVERKKEFKKGNSKYKVNYLKSDCSDRSLLTAA